MGYNWHWRVLFEAEPGGTGTYLHYLVVGLGWTLATALAACVIALTLGAVIGTVRTTRLGWAVRLGNLYVEIFRNIPLIVQMFLWFFVAPELLPKAAGDWIKQMPPPWGMYIPAVMCLGIFTSVRIAEQVRAGMTHYHVCVDTDCLPVGQVIPKADPWIHFGDGKTEIEMQLKPGQHKLVLQSGDDMHRTIEGLCEVITVNVVE